MDDLSFINNEDLWPVWPYLPLKKVKEFKLGVIVSGRGFTVHLLNMIEIQGRVSLDSCEKEVYDTPEAVIEAGWIVD